MTPCAVSLLSLFIFPAAAAPRERPPAGSSDFVAAIERAKDELFPKIVYIHVIQEQYEEGSRARQQVSGSGVIISSDGYIVTNAHVVEGAVAVRCLLSDQSHWEAEIVGRDREADLALLKLKLPAPTAALPFARFGDSRGLHVGDFVIAMGCPLGLSRSVSFGVVSNPAQFIGEQYEYNWIQTDASINPGNSGGPLVGLDGRIVGINTLGVFGAQGLGFAIPSEFVEKVLAELKTAGRVARSWNGIQLQALHDFDSDTYFEGTEGVLVGGLDPDSPALDSGLKVGDLVLSAAGRTVSGVYPEDLPAVHRALAMLPPGQPAPLVVRRGREFVTVTLVPKAKEESRERSFECLDWMLTLSEIERFDDPSLYYFRKKGVYVLGVKPGGNAQRGGLRPLDILTRVDGAEVGSLADAKADCQRSTDRAPEKRKLLVEVLRRGLPVKLVLDYTRGQASYEEEK